MQGSREQKRKFLYQQIVSKGYNADDFHQQFLAKTGKQFSLDKWSLEDLQNFVIEYQNSVKSKQVENSKQKNQKYLSEEITNKGYDLSDFNSYLLLNNDNSTNVEEWDFIKLQQFVTEYKQLVKQRKSQQTIREKQRFLVSEIIDKGFDSQDFHRFFLEKNNNSGDINDWGMDRIKDFVAKYQQSVYNKRQQESLQEKRKYLVAEIIDKGFSNEDFQEYLLRNKGNSINIANWDFQQLKQFVVEYQNSVYEKRVLQNREQKQKYLVLQIIQKGYDSGDFQEALLQNTQHHVNLDEWELEQLKKFVQNYQRTYEERKKERKRQQKIDYLTEQIIEKRYDPDDFQEYLKDMSWNKGETNLENWELEELKKYVTQYQEEMRRKEQRIDDLVEKKIKKAKKKKNKDKQREKRQGEDQTKSEKNKKSPSSSPDKDKIKIQQEVQPSDKQFQFNLMTGQESFSQIIECIQVPPNQLLRKDVEIRITKYQKNEGGLFENFYYTYIVQTPCLSKTVQRRYNDFVWLKQTLQYNHPGLPVPPVAKKGSYRRSDQKHLNKRRMILEKFLNQIVQIPVLKADLIFQNFLEINNYVQFEKFKSDYKRTSSIELTKVRNFRGKLNVGIDPEMNKFLINSQKFIAQQQPLTKKLFKDYKAVATSLQETAKTLAGISTLCNDLNQKDEFFRKQSNLRVLPCNTYSMLKQSSQKFAQLLVRQAKTLRTQIYSTIKYENLNLLNYLESFEKLKAYQEEYLLLSNNLYRKKQKIYEQRNMMKWVLPNSNAKADKSQAIKKMLLNQQTHEFDKIRISYGLRNFSMFQEINRHFSKNHQYMAKFLSTYFRIQNQIANQMKQVWWESQVQASTLYEGKVIKKLS